MYRKVIAPFIACTLLAFLAYLVYLLAQPFLAAIGFGVVLTVITFPSTSGSGGNSRERRGGGDPDGPAGPPPAGVARRGADRRPGPAGGGRLPLGRKRRRAGRTRYSASWPRSTRTGATRFSAGGRVGPPQIEAFAADATQTVPRR